MSPDSNPEDGPVEIPLDGVLDLHTFKPREIGDLIPGWITECQEHGILELRIIHGKGTGQLQRSVHAILSRHPEVLTYSLASGLYGGIGATIVHLRPKQPTVLAAV